MKSIMSETEMYEFCEQQRDPDGYCRCCDGCSGPSPSKMAK